MTEPLSKKSENLIVLYTDNKEEAMSKMAILLPLLPKMIVSYTPEGFLIRLLFNFFIWL
ncbi:hypothetical protein MCW_01191 [Cardidatus Bartonella washoeensis 085-0475]|uniref:Uncharacterized protein n=1 Tax=Cardidatus Bartonella washoeensis 085-0475 TaxID=1094564 RepID=J0Z9C1_9HYPH|nr:hypothetical protein MCW_01191 [Bartonella washoeensis 085-0475]